MAIIIGAGTIASFAGACVISVSWGYSPNTQRLYCLGSWSPHQSLDRPTETVSLSIYAPGPSYNIPASDACENVSSDVSVSVSPGGCGTPLGGVSGNWGITSYSYSKDDPQAPGQESWSFTRWVGENVPDYVIRGISEGSATDPIVNTGIVFEGTTSEGTSGNVSAGGVGRADKTYYGVVAVIGGGTSARGKIGSGSASIPLTPLWL